MQRKIRKAVIPAAGLGTRFLPATKAQPKEMLPIVDKPTLQYIIEEAVASGIEEILIITGKNKKSIEDHFDKSVELELELEQKGKTELLEIVRNISKMINRLLPDYSMLIIKIWYCLAVLTFRRNLPVKILCKTSFSNYGMTGNHW